MKTRVCNANGEDNYTSHTLQAGERGLVYPAYTFITPHWYREDWWLVESDPDCGVSDLTNVLNNTLSVELNPKVMINRTLAIEIQRLYINYDFTCSNSAPTNLAILH